MRCPTNGANKDPLTTILYTNPPLNHVITGNARKDAHSPLKSCYKSPISLRRWPKKRTCRILLSRETKAEHPPNDRTYSPKRRNRKLLPEATEPTEKIFTRYRRQTLALIQSHADLKPTLDTHTPILPLDEHPFRVETPLNLPSNTNNLPPTSPISLLDTRPTPKKNPILPINSTNTLPLYTQPADRNSRDRPINLPRPLTNPLGTLKLLQRSFVHASLRRQTYPKSRNPDKVLHPKHRARGMVPEEASSLESPCLTNRLNNPTHELTTEQQALIGCRYRNTPRPITVPLPKLVFITPLRETFTRRDTAVILVKANGILFCNCSQAVLPLRQRTLTSVPVRPPFPGKHTPTVLTKLAPTPCTTTAPTPPLANKQLAIPALFTEMNNFPDDGVPYH